MTVTSVQNTHTHTILIVDDTPANLSVAVDALESQGYQVMTAQDGEEGLQRVAFIQPDLILLDVMMPEMDGFEICRRLKAQASTQDIPVIFMTALAETKNKVTGFEVGGVDYITKPLQLDELLVRVKTHLKLRDFNTQLKNKVDQLEALSNENLMFRNIINHIKNQTVMIHDINDSARVIYANDAACAHFGVDRETLLTWTPLNWDPHFNTNVLAEVSAAVAQRNSLVFETEHLVASGELIPVEVSLYFIENDNYPIAVTYSRDLRDQKAKEAQRLQDAKEEAVRKEITLFAQNVPGLMFSYKPNQSVYGAISYLSDAIRDIFGLSIKEVKGDVTQLFALIHSEDLQHVKNSLTCIEHPKACEFCNKNETCFNRQNPVTLGCELHQIEIEFRIAHPKNGERWIKMLAALEFSNPYQPQWHGFMYDITESKHMKSELDSQSKFQQSILDAICAVDIQLMVVESGRIIHVGNRMITRQLGYTDAEIEAHPHFINIIHPDDRVRVMNYHMRRIAGEAVPDNYELGIITRDGQRREYETSAATVPDTNPIRTIVIGRDITERKQAEAQLLFFRHGVENSAPMIWINAANMQVAYANKAACTQLGFEPSEIIGIPASDFDCNYNKDYIDALTKKLRENQLPLSIESIYQAMDGRTIEVMITYALLENETRSVIVASIQDISELKKIEQSLRNANLSANLAMDISNIGVWSATLDGSQTYISSERKMCMLGDPPKSDYRYSITDDWLVNIHAADSQYAEITMKSFMDFSAGLSEKWEATFPYKRPLDKKVIWIRTLGIVTKYKDGIPFEIMGVSQDVTDTIHIQKNLENAANQAELASIAKSNFLANMSHEIRTPMNAIIGLNQLLLDTELTFKQHDYLQKIQSSSNALLRILNDILDYSKIEANQLDLEETAFSLDNVFSSAANLFSISAAEKEIEIIFDISPKIPKVLSGDPMRLGQIITNLLGNAIKFTTHGKILIRAESRISGRKKKSPGRILGDFTSKQQETQEKNQLYISISDTGIGMTKEQCTKLFRPFSQADTSTSRKFGGTGLGLSIAKRLIELMGGSIGVTSTIGKGSTFFLTLPLIVATEDLQQQHHTKLSSMRTLIIDDSKSLVNALEAMLRSWSFEVCHAHTSKEGLQKTREAEQSGRPFELFLIDIDMPEINGIELAHIIRSEQTQKFLGYSPVAIMVNTLDRDELADSAKNIHFDAVIQKPISPSSLLDAIISLQVNQANNVNLPLTPKQKTLFEKTSAIHGAHVLLVEDNQTNQLVAKEFLKQMGLFVDIANDGIEAVELVGRKQYDAVLMDLQMPNMNGFEATNKIRACGYTTLPVIAMTASAMISDKQAVANAGMCEHISKPIDSYTLASVLLRWVPSRIKTLTNQKDKLAAMKATPAEFYLDGLDTSYAVSRLDGNWHLLRQTILSFNQNFANAIDQLNTYLATGKILDAVRLVHTIKGLSLAIGAADLGRQAKTLEEELLAGTQTTLSDFCAALSSVLNSISTLPEPSAITVKSIPFDLSRTSSLLRELLSILESNGIVPYDLQEGLRIDLFGHIQPKQIEVLMQQINNLNYAAAKQNLKQISVVIGVDLSKKS